MTPFWASVIFTAVTFNLGYWSGYLVRKHLYK